MLVLFLGDVTQQEGSIYLMQLLLLSQPLKQAKSVGVSRPIREVDVRRNKPVHGRFAISRKLSNLTA